MLTSTSAPWAGALPTKINYLPMTEVMEHARACPLVEGSAASPPGSLFRGLTIGVLRQNGPTARLLGRSILQIASLTERHTLSEVTGNWITPPKECEGQFGNFRPCPGWIGRFWLSVKPSLESVEDDENPQNIYEKKRPNRTHKHQS